MNERIQELMERSMELVDPYALEGEFGPRRLNEQKFAELIVRECISKAEDYGLGCDAVEQLKADFGVEAGGYDEGYADAKHLYSDSEEFDK